MSVTLEPNPRTPPRHAPSLHGPKAAAASVAAPSPYLRLHALRRVGVFRCGGLGEVLCAQPLLRSVRAACPTAELTWIGPPWAEELSARWGLVDRYITFPDAGVRHRPPSTDALRRFLSEVHAAQLTLLLQTHDAMDAVHAFVGACGAFQTAGFRAPGDDEPAPGNRLHVAPVRAGHEIDRLLALTRHLGMRDADCELDVPVHAKDHEALERLWPEVTTAAPFVCVQAGAPSPSRRWPADRHAAVAQHLARRGYTIVLVGEADEAASAAAVGDLLPKPPVNLVGRTSLWTLSALLSRAELLIGHDTGLSLLAAAIGTPSVIVSLATDTARWGPPAPELHHVIAQALRCRPCGHDTCPTQHECAGFVSVREVVAAAEALLNRRVRAGAAASCGVLMPLVPPVPQVPPTPDRTVPINLRPAPPDADGPPSPD